MRLIKNLFGKKKKKNTPPAILSEPARGAKPELTPQAWLLELFKRHGLVSTVHDEWVLPNANLPGIRGTWHPGETHGRLDMQVLVRDGVLIEECFGGFGVGDFGLADGLQNFTINSFHVLMSALWAHHDPEQVESEAWNVGSRRFDVFIGNVGTRGSAGVAPSMPAGMMTTLEDAIRHESLERDLHWFRFYVGHVKGEFTFEALKDNEPWAAGESALASCGWTPTDKFYSARLFMMLRASVDEAQTPV
jgi:hypothetical protein